MKSKGTCKVSDDQLIRELRKGDRKSMGELYCKYFPRVYHTCYSYAKNPEDSYDLAQDVILKAFSKIGSFAGDSSFSTWLYAITRNHCISQVSKRKTESITAIQSASHLYYEESGPEELEARIEKERLEADIISCLDILPETERRMLELKYYHFFSVNDLQREFNLSASAVKMRLLRARQRIEQMVSVQVAA